MSNLMDKLANKLGGNNEQEQTHQGPSSSTRSKSGQTGRNQQSFSTQDEQQSFGSNQYGGNNDMNSQRYGQGGDDNMAFIPESGMGARTQGGGQGQNMGAFDQTDAPRTSGRQPGGLQQGSTRGQTNQGMGSDQDMLDSTLQSEQQQQFQRRF